MTPADQTPARTRRPSLARVAAGALAAAAAMALAAPAAQAEVKSFTHESRLLKPLQSERIPAFQCPADYPYLVNRNYAPAGTTLINGVEVLQSSSPWAIGVHIGLASITPRDPDRKIYHKGILDHWSAGSATNWALTDARYILRLHCTDLKSEASWAAPSDRA